MNTKHWWKLPGGTELPDGLQVRNDHGDHWVIEPSEPVTVDEFLHLVQSTLNDWTHCYICYPKERSWRRSARTPFFRTYLHTEGRGDLF